jgi:hypothetical protein
MSGATKEIGAPENRIHKFQRNFVLTPRYEDLKPDTWTRSHRSLILSDRMMGKSTREQYVVKQV